MTIQKWGGVAALVEALTYVFGMILFLGVLNPGETEGPAAYLAFVLAKRDVFFVGYCVIGLLFGVSLIVLVHSLYRRMSALAPDLSVCTAVLGYIWAGIVLASTMIFLVGLESLVRFFPENPDSAVTIYRSMTIVVDALGGGIELVGALWVLGISYMGIRAGIFSRWLHYWGVLVGLAGGLTLFAGLSFFSGNAVFDAMEAVFGLGQIVWFVGLGVVLLRDSSAPAATSSI